MIKILDCFLKPATRFSTASKLKDEGLEDLGIMRSERGCFEAEGGVKNAKENA